MEIRGSRVQNGYRVVAFRFHFGDQGARFLRSLGVLVVMGSLMGVCLQDRGWSQRHFVDQVVVRFSGVSCRVRW